MSLASLDQRRRSARRRLALLAAGLLVAGAGITAFFVLGSDDSGGGGGAQHGSAPSASAPVTTPTGGSKTPTALPTGKGVKDGVPVGYPHTTEGAISAAAHFYDVWDGFNPFAAETQARAIAVPEKAEEVAADAFRSSSAARLSSGLSVAGESDHANYLTFQTRAYRIDRAEADRVKFWLLLNSQTSAKGVQSSKTVVETAEMLWVDGDWRLVAVSYPTGQPKPPAAVPDSEDAAKKGWRSIAYEK
ncbi:hypothetical protein [Streptomyces syringium]|uniref:hypothetical protein n=1 Tax=Streptomyces syringium TaxID=76729 RepID=UPI003AAC2E8D